MKRDELLDVLSDLDAIEQHFENRIEIWRIIITPDWRVVIDPDWRAVINPGNEVRRIYRGSFQRPRGEEPQEENNR